MKTTKDEELVTCEQCRGKGKYPKWLRDQIHNALVNDVIHRPLGCYSGTGTRLGKTPQK